MSSTPLFDAISKRTASLPAAPTRFSVRSTPAPTSPITAPIDPAQSAVVSTALVAAIDDIPRRLAASAERQVRVSDEQRELVEALGDTFIRVVVDTLAAELERIVRERTVRA